MKKTKILSVVAVLFAMVLTGCNKNKTPSSVPSSEPEPSSEPAPSTEPVHTHSWDEGTVTTDPTCTQPGVKTFHCSGCSETKTEEVAALGHDWDQGTVTTNPTCTQPGVKTFHCSRCTETKTEAVAALGHSFDNGTITTNPTCTQPGVKTIACTRCGASSTEAVPALGHDWGEWSQTKDPTCKDTGEKTRTCKRCSTTEKDIIPTVAHTFNDWHQTKAPSCVAGEEQRECTICGETEKRSLDPSGNHNWSAWEVVVGKEPSCKKGQESRHCPNCNTTEYRDVAPTGDPHQWGTPTVVEDVLKLDENGDPITVEVPAPTSADANAKRIVNVCEKVGYTKEVCDICGTWRVVIDAAKATLAEGSTWKGHKDLEDNNIHGVKLNGNGNSYSFKFDFDQNADVVIYEVGCMDGGTSNLSRTFYSRQDNADLPNFEFKVNGDAIDLEPLKNVPFSTYLSEREDEDPLKAKNYSTFGEVLIGESSLKAGENTFVYKRLESFNLIITDLVLEVTPLGNHVHKAADDAPWINTDENYHYHFCEETDGKIVDRAKHTFGDLIVDTAATCEADGVGHQRCTVCGYLKENIKINKLGHDMSVIAANTAANEEHIASQTAICANNCGKSSITWSALDFDGTLSSGTSLVKVNGSTENNAVKTGNAENDGGQDNANPQVSTGNHYVYKVNADAAIPEAKLAFQVYTRSSDLQVFKTQDNDGKRGNYYNSETSEFTAAPARYGVRINDQEVYFDEAALASEAVAPKNTLAWFEFPLNSFGLNAGVNKIDVYSMGGYSQAGILKFQIIIPASAANVHTLNDGWVNTDENVHYKTSPDAGLEEARFFVSAHEWIEDPENPDVAPTCATPGTDYKMCKVCGAKAHSEIDALGHDVGENPQTIVDTEPSCISGVGHQVCVRCGNNVPVVIAPNAEHVWTPQTAVKNSENQDVIPLVCSVDNHAGAKMSVNDYSSETASFTDNTEDNLRPAQGGWIKYKIVVSEAGNYYISFGLKCKSNGGVAMSSRGFAVKVGETSAKVHNFGSQTPDNLSLNADTPVQVILVDSVALQQGENLIQIQCNGYRLHYAGDLIVGRV